MPSRSRAQQHLMAAAEHDATFPAARRLRQSMTHQQLHADASGSMKGKPEHVHASHQHPHKNLGPYLHPRKNRH